MRKNILKLVLIGFLLSLSTNIFSQEKDSIYITGRIVDGEKFPLAHTYIEIKETKTEVVSDFNGEYKINITQPLDSLGKITLIYSFLGFKTTEREIDSTILSPNESRVRDIRMEEDMQPIICYAFIGEKLPFHKRAWNWIKNLLKREEK